MARPILTVIAGCNGSGKSSFSNALTPLGTPSFDYDKEFLNFYNSMEDSELRARISHNKTKALLKNKVHSSIKNQVNFTYETNFNSTPMYWPKKFKTAGFQLIIFYFCLDSIEKAKKRVQIRVENGGHFVPEWEIENRYYLGYENLNKHWSFFDQIYLFDTSGYKIKPKHILTVIDKKIDFKNEIPDFLPQLIPSLLKNE